MRTHKLKCDPIPFCNLISGRKTFEFRANDQNYQIGDVLQLHETCLAARDRLDMQEVEFTGRTLKLVITHMATPEDGYGVPEGYCILSFKPVTTQKSQLPEDNPFTRQVGGEHYRKYGPYQPWAVLSKWLTAEELKGAMKKEVIAYLCREADKNGLEDIKKALHTMQIYLELIQQKASEENE